MAKKKVSTGGIKNKVEQLIDSLLDDALEGSVDIERLMSLQAIAKTAIDYLKINDKDTEGTLIQELFQEGENEKEGF